MANRFTNLSQATFTPLSMQEIMAVPMAKQQRHDAIIAGADEISAKEASVRSQDQDIVDQELSGLQERSASLADEIMSSGIKRGSSSKFRKLKRDTEKSYGADGIIGHALSQRNAIAESVKNFDDNGFGNQGLDYLKSKANEFKSFNEDGTKNYYQSQALDAYKDPIPVMRAAVNDIKSELSPEVVSFIEQGGDIDNLKKLAGTSELYAKDYRTLMSHVSNVVSGDRELQASMAQEALIMGLDPQQALDTGRLIAVQDEETGSISYDWLEGTSKTAQLMNSFGAIAASSPEFMKNKSLIASTTEKHDSKVLAINNTVNVSDDFAGMLETSVSIQQFEQDLDRIKNTLSEDMTPQEIKTLNNSIREKENEIRSAKNKLNHFIEEGESIFRKKHGDNAALGYAVYRDVIMNPENIKQNYTNAVVSSGKATKEDVDMIYKLFESGKINQLSELLVDKKLHRTSSDNRETLYKAKQSIERELGDGASLDDLNNYLNNRIFDAVLEKEDMSSLDKSFEFYFGKHKAENRFQSMIEVYGKELTGMAENNIDFKELNKIYNVNTLSGNDSVDETNEALNTAITTGTISSMYTVNASGEKERFSPKKIQELEEEYGMPLTGVDSFTTDHTGYLGGNRVLMSQLTFSDPENKDSKPETLMIPIVANDSFTSYMDDAASNSLSGEKKEIYEASKQWSYALRNIKYNDMGAQEISSKIGDNLNYSIDKQSSFGGGSKYIVEAIMEGKKQQIFYTTESGETIVPQTEEQLKLALTQFEKLFN